MRARLIVTGLSKDWKYDAEADVIHGVRIVSVGEAKGHGFYCDDEFVNDTVSAINSHQLGLKSRFGHPSMSSSALGTFLGRVKNAERKEFENGEISAVGSLYFDKTAHKTPNGDLATYVRELAESDPNAFGTSIVFSWEKKEYAKDKSDGRIHKHVGEQGDELDLVKLHTLYADDVVDDPAANSAFLDTSNAILSANATEFLDRFLADPKAVDKALSFLQAYQRTMALDKDDEEGTHRLFTHQELKDKAKEQNGVQKDKEGEEKVVPVEVPTKTDVPQENDGGTMTKCEACGNEFDYEAQAESSPGYVKCPGCGKEVDKAGKVKVEEAPAETPAVPAPAATDTPVPPVAADVPIVPADVPAVVEPPAKTDAELSAEKAAKDELRTKEVDAAIETLSEDGRVVPATEPLVRALLTAAWDIPEVVSYEEGYGNKKEMFIKDGIIAFLNTVPPIIRFREEGKSGGKIDDSLEGDKEADMVDAYATEHKCSMREARFALEQEGKIKSLTTKEGGS
jgi:DNA-directed RNA polymerase subunit RPC12/RpoP